MFGKVIVRAAPVFADSVVVQYSIDDGTKIAHFRMVVLDEEIVDQVRRPPAGRDTVEDRQSGDVVTMMNVLRLEPETKQFVQSAGIVLARGGENSNRPIFWIEFPGSREKSENTSAERGSVDLLHSFGHATRETEYDPTGLP